MVRCASLKLADNTGDFGLARCAGLIVAEYKGDLGLARCAEVRFLNCYEKSSAGKS